MRFLLGIILGGVLIVSGAYLYNSHNTLEAANSPASVRRPMVNWDVVGTKWEQFTHRAPAPNGPGSRVSCELELPSPLSLSSRPARWPDGFFVPADKRLLHRHDLI